MENKEPESIEIPEAEFNKILQALDKAVNALPLSKSPAGDWVNIMSLIRDAYEQDAIDCVNQHIPQTVTNGPLPIPDISEKDIAGFDRVYASMEELSNIKGKEDTDIMMMDGINNVMCVYRLLGKVAIGTKKS